MTLDRFFVLAGSGFMAVVVLLVALICLLLAVLWVFQFIEEHGWRKIWRGTVATAKVFAWVVGVGALILAVLAAIGWGVEHFFHFNFVIAQ